MVLPRFAWIAQSVAAITAVALALATHDVLPFVSALLLALLVIECARARGYAQPVWPLIALVTDAAIWGMIFIYSGPQNARAEYPELGVAALVFPACLLFAINATSVAVRTILQKHKITVFEIVQVMIAFGLAISSVLFFAPNAVLILGIACLVLSAAAYAASFRYLGRCAERRNFRVFSMWSAALLVAGVLWALPQPGVRHRARGCSFGRVYCRCANQLEYPRTARRSISVHGCRGFRCSAVYLRRSCGLAASRTLNDSVDRRVRCGFGLCCGNGQKR